MARVKLFLSGDPDADALLGKDPLALLIGMVLDQQVPLEKAFSSPAELARRRGRRLEAADLAGMDPGELAAIFADRPALHRFPGSMAARVQALCQALVDGYHGSAAAVWQRVPDGSTLLARVKALPGFGDQKAKIFVALLGKQFGVRPPGWEEASAPFSQPGSFRSVADIVDAPSRDRVRQFKQALKAAAAPGKADPAAAGRRATTGPSTTPAAARRRPRGARSG